MNRRTGFTLAEVLATLVLIGLVLPVVMQGISLALKAAEDASKRGEAASLAEAKLNELVLLGDENREMSGDFGPDWAGFRWTRTELAVDDAMIEVAVEVQWETRGQPRALALTTWRAPASAVTTTDTEDTPAGETSP